MKEFRVEWAQCPTNHNPLRVVFVEAATEDDARAIVRDYIERKYGIGWYVIKKATVAVKPPAGRIIDK